MRISGDTYIECENVCKICQKHYSIVDSAWVQEVNTSKAAILTLAHHLETSDRIARKTCRREDAGCFDGRFCSL